MNCYFLRHGIAVAPQAWHGSDDDRPLTPEGEKRMEREARAIADLDLDVDTIVTSPLLRARQTAEIVADRLRVGDGLVEDARVAHGFDADGVVAILREHDRAASVMFVGHEPSMSATVGRLVGGASIELKKGGLAGVELDDPPAGAGTLICLIPPKVLAALGKR
ncbi:MAG TPA: phosphohistidine phosphatase SixA [Candidatus Cybelea sp.]